MNPREYEALFAVEDRHWWFVGLRREIGEALRALKPSDGGSGRWLDAGSGTGGLLAGLADWPGPRVGLEISADGLFLARSRSLRQLVRGSAGTLPFAGGSFQAITSIDVLCHRGVDEPEALREMWRCLRKGGLLVLQVPAFDWLRSEHDDAVWTNRRYTRREVRRLIEQAAFSIRRCFYRNTLLFPLAALRRLARQGRVRGTEARSDVRPPSVLSQAAFSAVLRIELGLRRLGLSLPFGLSVFIVAEKR